MLTVPIPQQQNFNDCGIFVLEQVINCVRRIFTNEHRVPYVTQKVVSWRRKNLRELLAAIYKEAADQESGDCGDVDMMLRKNSAFGDYVRKMLSDLPDDVAPSFEPIEIPDYSEAPILDKKAEKEKRAAAKKAEEEKAAAAAKAKAKAKNAPKKDSESPQRKRSRSRSKKRKTRSRSKSRGKGKVRRSRSKDKRRSSRSRDRRERRRSRSRDRRRRSPSPRRERNGDRRR